MIGAVRQVHGVEDEKRPVAIVFDELADVVQVHVRPVFSGKRTDLTVVVDFGIPIEVGGPGIVAPLVEPRLSRLLSATNRHLPFGRQAGAITLGLEYVSDRALAPGECPLAKEVPMAVFARQDLDSRRYAQIHRVTMVESKAFTCESIQLRRGEMGRAVGTKNRIAGVIGHDQDDARFPCRGFRGGSQACRQK